VRALGETARLVITMQLGYILLLPFLVEEATGRPAYPIIHDQNPAVLQMYCERLRLGRPLVLTTFSSADIRQWLESDGIMIANLDTSYPGTRRVRTMPFLGGQLTVPVGLLSLAAERSFDVRAMAAPGSRGRITLEVSSQLSGDVEKVLGQYGACFERWVAAHPEQWMAWASLEEPC
jgi:lauroyl/myristoyl acyltransferase